MNKQQRTKQVRQSAYEFKDPLVGSLPDSISVQQFLDSWANELKIFTDALNKKNISKHSFQKLPRHLWRRAMSHNPYWIPLSVWYKALAETKENPLRS